MLDGQIRRNRDGGKIFPFVSPKNEDLFEGFFNSEHEDSHVFSLLRSNAVKTDISIFVAYVTPEVAEYLRDRCNPNNRKLSRKHSLILQKAVSNSEFKLNYVPLVFDWNGHLVDGQHRLDAIVKSGVPAYFSIVYGVDPELFTTYDVTKIRKSRDDLDVKGFENYANLETVIKYLYRYENDTSKSKEGHTGATRDEVLLFAMQRPDLQDDIRTAGRVYRENHFSLAALAACHHIFKDISELECDVFFDQLTYGENLEKGDPTHTLRSMANNQGRIKNSNKKSPVDWGPRAQMARIIIAWNLFRKDQKAGKAIGWTSTKAFPIAI